MDMGAFGEDPDDELAILEELERKDTRGPLQRSHASLSDCEVSFGESCFWESTRRLFNSWLFQAKRPHSWMKEKDLPKFFRFALRRPIMDERTFRWIMRSMNIELESSFGDVRRPHTRPIGRSRQLMFGIDVDAKTNVHVSSRLRHSIPRDAREGIDRVSEEAKRLYQKRNDRQEILLRQLWTVYEHVQNGSIDIDTATWHYRDALDNQGLSDESLVICFEELDIPTDHIPTKHRKARLGCVQSRFRSDVQSEDTIESIEEPHPEEKQVVKKIVKYIGLLRGGEFHELEVIPMIQECLQGLTLESNTISDILDLQEDDEMTGLIMWEAACEESAADASDRSSMQYFSPSSSEDEYQETDEAEERPLRAVTVPDPHAEKEANHDAPVAIAVDVTESPGIPGSRDMDYQNGVKQNEPKQPEENSIDQSPTSPSVAHLDGLPTHSQANEAESRFLSPRSPISKHSSLKELDCQVDGKPDWEPTRGRAKIRRPRPSSPEEGSTTGMWGLLMPTREARKLAHQFKLPQDTVDALRSISPRKAKRERAAYAKTLITFPKSKRKASMTLDKDGPLKSPKYHDHSDLFAREGEDQDTFVRSHFDSDEIISENMCMQCLQEPCKCEGGSSAYSFSEPECSECLQESCMCGHISPLGQAEQTSLTKAKTLHDALHAKLVDRTRSDSPKQPDTLLAYLARLLNEKDMLASIKQLEEQSPSDRAIAAAKSIFDHIQYAIHAGEELCMSGDEDQEAVRILDAIIGSSRNLTDHAEDLHHETTGESIPISADNGRLNGVIEGSDLVSSLLNSSPGQENVPAPLLNSVASAASLPKTQSNIANGAILEANSTPVAKQVSTYLSTSAQSSSVRSLGPSAEIEDAVQSKTIQAVNVPDSSAAGDLSRAESHSGSPERGHTPTAGGHAPKAEYPAKSPPDSSLSFSTSLSGQVSNDPVDAKDDTDDAVGASMTRQPQATTGDTVDNGIATPSPSAPRPGARELIRTTSSSSPGAENQNLPDDLSSASRRPSLERNKAQATQRADLFGPGFKTLPLWPAGLPGKAGLEWTGMTPERALAFAEEEAFRQRKSLGFFMEERRAIRDCIKKENEYTNSVLSHHSFFQNASGLSSSSSTTNTSPLNKLFDKYRGRSNS